MKYNYEQTRNDYETPPELVFKALEITNKGFDCDVCCSRMNIPAKNYYLEGETEGLTTDWMGLNWCNPPFYECSKWIKKAFIEQQKLNCRDGRTLIGDEQHSVGDDYAVGAA